MALDDIVKKEETAQKAQGNSLEQRVRLTPGRKIRRGIAIAATVAGAYLTGGALLGAAYAAKTAGASILTGVLYTAGHRIGKKLFPKVKKVPRKKSEFIMGAIFGALGYITYAAVPLLIPGSILFQAGVLAAGPVQANNVAFLTYNYLFDRKSPGEVIRGLNPKYLFKKELSKEELKRSTYHEVKRIWKDYVYKDMKLVFPITLAGGVAYKYAILKYLPNAFMQNSATAALSVLFRTAGDWLESGKLNNEKYAKKETGISERKTPGRSGAPVLAPSPG